METSYPRAPGRVSLPGDLLPQSLQNVRLAFKNSPWAPRAEGSAQGPNSEEGLTPPPLPAGQLGRAALLW